MKQALEILVVATLLKEQQRRIFQSEHRHSGHHGIGHGVTAIGFVARIGKKFRSQANLPNERIKGKMSPCLGRNGIWVQHERDSEDVFAEALQVPLRAAMIHQLPLNACPSQKKSELKLLAEQAYETLAVIAAVLPQNQNAFGAAGNCCLVDRIKADCAV